MDSLSGIVTILIAISVAAEKLVDIIKGIFPWLSQENPDAAKERGRKIILQLLSAVLGILTTLFAASGLIKLPSIIALGLNSIAGMILLGLLSSGGASFWTSIQGYVAKVKDIKKVEAAEARVKAAATVAAVAKGGGIASRALTNGAHVLDANEATFALTDGVNQGVIDQAQANLDEAVRIANNVLGGYKESPPQPPKKPVKH